MTIWRKNTNLAYELWCLTAWAQFLVLPIPTVVKLLSFHLPFYGRVKIIMSSIMGHNRLNDIIPVKMLHKVKHSENM